MQVKAKYKAQVDHLRGQLASVEQTNAQLTSQVAALTEQLRKLRCSTEGSTDKLTNGVVIKQERRDSADSDITIDASTSTASEWASSPTGSNNSGKACDPPPPRPVTT